MTTKDPSNRSARELVITRDVDAPRELVWDAMTDPRQVICWWGPLGFTTTVEEMDVRPGGIWKHVMRGPDGTEYPNWSVFIEVVKPERLVYSHGGRRKDGPSVKFESTWTFDALAPNRTRVTIRMLFDSETERDNIIRDFDAREGGKQTLGRLAGHLPKMQKERE